MAIDLKKVMTRPTGQTKSWYRYLYFQIRIWLHCFRLMGANRCLTQAAALAYHTIFGLVPLTIVTLMVFQLFPATRELGDELRRLAYEQLNLTSIQYPLDPADPDGETISMAARLDELAQGFIAQTNTGTITAIGLALVSWAAIALMTTIERTFNRIYHVSTHRRFLHRLFNYWGLLTLGVIFLALILYVHTQSLIASGVYLRIFNFFQPVIPFLTSLAAFFLLYVFLPNTRVNPWAALWGALVVTLIWTVAKIGFQMYVTRFMPLFVVYGALGLIPLTVLWIFISWLIVLFGLQLTYATQNIKRLDAAELARIDRQDRCFLANDQTVIRIMEYVLNAFERKDQKPVSVEAVAWRLDMPTDFTEKILNHLVNSGLLCHTSEPANGYVPATDGSHITLDEVARAIEAVSFAQARPDGRMRQVFDTMYQQLSAHTLKEVLNPEEDFTQVNEAEPQPESRIELDNA